eukprot:CAMPEP_0179260032 /NCGR_PEP_ID=MMETSP0797-20121207/26129_1 /TAXON_ID=47934 /ORGANISM="Dinophysis acuminata, Strain DAEP01" /LENGTH=131 /DNA_ID=CAMNT_0020968097 /DNA_START=73 /DNA_END=468 /DNA_ORIENTATION=+
MSTPMNSCLGGSRPLDKRSTGSRAHYPYASEIPDLDTAASWARLLMPSFIPSFEQFGCMGPTIKVNKTTRKDSKPKVSFSASPPEIHLVTVMDSDDKYWQSVNEIVDTESYYADDPELAALLNYAYSVERH